MVDSNKAHLVEYFTKVHFLSISFKLMTFTQLHFKNKRCTFDSTTFFGGMLALLVAFGSQLFKDTAWLLSSSVFELVLLIVVALV